MNTPQLKQFIANEITKWVAGNFDINFEAGMTNPKNWKRVFKSSYDLTNRAKDPNNSNGGEMLDNYVYEPYDTFGTYDAFVYNSNILTKRSGKVVVRGFYYIGPCADSDENDIVIFTDEEDMNVLITIGHQD